jgi:hypothetical protein
MIQVCSNFGRARVFIINTCPDELRVMGVSFGGFILVEDFSWSGLAEGVGGGLL